MSVKIRAEEQSDIEEISRITTAAFKDTEHSSHTEAAIIDALRKANALKISVVAVKENEIVGHAAISPVLINGESLGWCGLGPVSVRPDQQGRGIGSVLVRDALDQLSRSGAKGCVVLGEPDFYGKFGFEANPALKLEEVPAEYFTCLHLSGDMPIGVVTYHPAFEA